MPYPRKLSTSTLIPTIVNGGRKWFIEFFNDGYDWIVDIDL